MNNKNKQNLFGVKQLVLNATVQNIQQIVSAHAKGQERDFLLWIFDEANTYHKDYLQVTGINKICELASMLLHDVISQEEFAQLSPYLGILNAYFYFEIVSDNLGIGLADKNNANLSTQRKLLHRFNDIMQQKLMNPEMDIHPLLSLQMDDVQQFSKFILSIFPSEIQKFTHLYEEAHPTLAGHLQHDGLSYLAMNIEACVNVSKQIVDSLVMPFIVENLCSRYAAGNALLSDGSNLQNRLQYGIHTILIIPTLLYITAAINCIVPDEKWFEVIEQGLLYEAVKIAACLIRISNDIGTYLLNKDSAQLQMLKGKVEHDYKQNQRRNTQLTFLDFLSKLAEDEKNLLTRIRKDLKYGEFNIVLDLVRGMEDNETALSLFFSSIEKYAEIYQQQRKKLAEVLEKIETVLGNKKITLPILRMVTFHEELYEKQFEHRGGEFATKH